eukprot:3586031-Rhodomonas_salina.1
MPGGGAKWGCIPGKGGGPMPNTGAAPPNPIAVGAGACCMSLAAGFRGPLGLAVCMAAGCWER